MHDNREECGVSAPHAEVLLFRQKDPKPWAPGRGPSGAFAPVPKVWAAELASLRQSSPPHRVRDRGAATPAGALGWRHGMAGTTAPSSVAAPSHGAVRWLHQQRVRRQKKEKAKTTTNYKDAGSSITNVEDDRGGRVFRGIGTGAQPCPQAPWGGAMGWRGVRRGRAA